MSVATSRQAGHTPLLSTQEMGGNFTRMESAGSTGLPSLRCPVKAKVVFLTHYIPLYQVRVLQEVTKRLSDFHILLSTPIEPNRDFRPDWTGLDVSIQRTITFRRPWRHAEAGFRDRLYVHVPYDTINQLRRIQPDVVVSHELGARSAAAAAFCRSTGTPLVLATFMSEHTEIGRGRLRHGLRRRLIRAADAITFNGPSCCRVLESLGSEPTQLFPWSYAADDRRFCSDTEVPPRDEAAVKGRLLCIGQLTERKGVDRVVEQLRCFCRSRSASLQLTLVGDGPRRNALEAIAKELESSQEGLTLRLLGNQPAEELPRLMQQHSLVMAPTLADEWLLVVNEAMHLGMPVLGSIYSQAVTTLVKNGENGWRYDPLADKPPSSRTPSADASTLDQALQSYLDTPDEELATMRHQARQTVRELTPQRSATEFCKAVEAVLGSGKNSTSPSDRNDHFGDGGRSAESDRPNATTGGDR